MAYGDSKASRSSYGGGGFSYTYNDLGRGKSKTRYEQFEKCFLRAYDADELDNFVALKCSYYTIEAFSNFVEAATVRYNVHDWATNRYEDPDHNDGRARRLVLSKTKRSYWLQLQEAAKQAIETLREQRNKRFAEMAEKTAHDRAMFEAERVLRYKEQNQALMLDADMIAGTVYSDFDQAYKRHSQYGRDEGEWIDDPVSLLSTGYGYGTETEKPSGLKVHINLALDLSNSMVNNRIHADATKTLVRFHLVMRNLITQHQDISAATFSFSDNDTYDATKEGKLAKLISDHSEQIDTDKRFLGNLEIYRETKSWYFSGTDTWFYPLFERLLNHEKRHNLIGTTRIDLIITDAVFEHKTDGTRCSDIQYERGPGVKSVFLNFVPENLRVGNVLPQNCIEYGVDINNIDGIIRIILSEVAGIHV